MTPEADTAQAGGDSRRDRLLEHAIVEFAEKGLAGARVDEIARRAGVNKQLLYYYFESKRGLYEAAVELMVGRTQTMASAREHGTGRPEELLDIMGSIHDPHITRWRRLLVWEALERTTDDIARQDRRLEVWDQRIADVRAAQESGAVDPTLDPELLCLALVVLQLAPYLIPQVTTMIAGVAPEDPEFETRQTEFLEQLVAHLAPAGGPGAR